MYVACACLSWVHLAWAFNNSNSSADNGSSNTNSSVAWISQRFPNIEIRNFIDSTHNESLWQPTSLLMIRPEVVIIVNSRKHVIQIADVEEGFIAILAGKFDQYGSADSLEGTSAEFHMPLSIAGPNLQPPPYFIVTDNVRGCIRRIEVAGTFPVSTLVCKNAADTTNPLWDPKDVAVMLNGDLFIANGIDHNVIFYSQQHKILQVYAGQSSVSGFVDGDALTAARFNQPIGITYHDGVLYVSDYVNNAIRSITTTYKQQGLPRVVSTLVGVPMLGTSGFMDGLFANARLKGPKSLRIVARQYVAVADSGNGAIRLLDLENGLVSTIFGDGTSAVVTSDTLQSRASAIWGLDGSFNARTIVFAEADTNTIKIICLDGCPTTLANTSWQFEKGVAKEQENLAEDAEEIFQTTSAASMGTTSSTESALFTTSSTESALVTTSPSLPENMSTTSPALPENMSTTPMPANMSTDVVLSTITSTVT